MDENTRQLITNAKNIAVIPSQEPEAVTAALALFYSIQESGKHATVLIDAIPEKLQFLIPSLDFIKTPKNFVISIPRTAADISQIHYEKTDSHLKIHFTATSGHVKKEDLSFYTEEPSPNLIITLGIADFKNHLETKLDTAGFLLGAQVLAITKNSSLAEGTLPAVTATGPISKESATCLLAGLALHYDNFKSPEVRAETFHLVSELMKKGADYHTIITHLSR